MVTIRTLLSIGNQFGYYFRQLDVKTAFLNGDLREDVYVYPPEGMNCDKGCVFKLMKSPYGLKQSSKCWNNRINDFLLKSGFKRSENNYCLYSRVHGKDMVYLILYVDDIILMGPNLSHIELCKEMLTDEFDIKDKGELKNFLGLEISYDRDKGILKLNQKRYILSILRKFTFEGVTPIEPRLKFNKSDKGDEVKKPTKELIGCLLYLMLGSRLDLSFAINLFSRYQDEFAGEIWIHLKRVLRYLKGTIELTLNFTRKYKESPLVCYVDSDWGSDVNNRRSVSGYAIKVFGNTVSWITRKQNSVGLSTAEAEFVALCNSVVDVL